MECKGQFLIVGPIPDPVLMEPKWNVKSPGMWSTLDGCRRINGTKVECKVSSLLL